MGMRPRERGGHAVKKGGANSNHEGAALGRRVQQAFHPHSLQVNDHFIVRCGRHPANECTSTRIGSKWSPSVCHASRPSFLSLHSKSPPLPPSLPRHTSQRPVAAANVHGGREGRGERPQAWRVPSHRAREGRAARASALLRCFSAEAVVVLWWWFVVV
jgi:hypothetical protein